MMIQFCKKSTKIHCYFYFIFICTTMDNYFRLTCYKCYVVMNLFFLVGLSEASSFTFSAEYACMCNINYLLIMVLFKKSPSPMLYPGANNWNT